jgi:hypothetical protein
MSRSHFGPVPELDFGPYHDEALLDPWPGYRLLRDAGPAVWLPQYETFALTRTPPSGAPSRTGNRSPPALAS